MTIRRDLAVYAACGDLMRRLRAGVEECDQPPLRLAAAPLPAGADAATLALYRQDNAAASRKAILPALKRALATTLVLELDLWNLCVCVSVWTGRVVVNRNVIGRTADRRAVPRASTTRRRTRRPTAAPTTPTSVNGSAPLFHLETCSSVPILKWMSLVCSSTCRRC